MGIREAFNQRHVTSIAGAAIIVAVLVWRFTGSGSGLGGQAGTQAFFSIDDGKSWFADNSRRIPPFEKDGKPAYQCFVWTCDGGKTKFASHLRRYTPEGKKALQAMQAKGGATDPASVKSVMTGVEVKLVGNGDDPKNWIKESDPQAGRITQPMCKEGNTENLEPVMP